jgi:hypothetical protein
MRRHVVLAFLDFDYRANALRQEINPAWEEKVRELHVANRKQLMAGLKEQYGGASIEQKVAVAASRCAACLQRGRWEEGEARQEIRSPAEIQKKGSLGSEEDCSTGEISIGAA